jgi:hypothetical protein
MFWEKTGGFRPIRVGEGCFLETCGGVRGYAATGGGRVHFCLPKNWGLCDLGPRTYVLHFFHGATVLPLNSLRACSLIRCKNPSSSIIETLPTLFVVTQEPGLHGHNHQKYLCICLFLCYMSTIGGYAITKDLLLTHKQQFF